MRLAAHLLSLVVLAGGDPQVPRVEITPVLHTGDPAPGIPGATMTLFLPPQIDGAGNVLIDAFYMLDGGSSAGRGLWCGPPGALQLVTFTGMQAPDLAPGVVIDSTGDTWLAENGWIGFSGHLSGPGVVSGVNDIANFIGQPGDIRKVLQGGDPAPGLEPGTVIDVSSSNGLTPWLSDNATLLVIAWLAGPQVDEINDQAIWIGPRDDLQLIWRKGMEAPGTNGARFAWQDGVMFNDNHEIAFRGGLVREGGIDHSNDGGLWAGGVNGLEMLARELEEAPGTGACYFGFNHPAFNSLGTVMFSALLTGRGVTSENDGGLWSLAGEQMKLLGREGDFVPEIGPGVEVQSIGSPHVNACEKVLYRVKYRGDSIDNSNAWAMYLGALDAPEQTLRDGDPAPHFEDGTLLTFVGGIPGFVAMNDVGDIIAPTEIAGENVSNENQVVLWLWNRVREEWFPLLRSGTTIEGRTLSIPGQLDLISAYWNKTGGSDGQRQSFNDARQLAIKLKFTDGTHGVFVLHPLWDGDHDGDGDVDFVDFSMLQTCLGGAGAAAPAECEVFDFDNDEDVDLFDYEQFLNAETGPA